MQLELFKQKIFLEILSAKSRWISEEKKRVAKKDDEFRHPNTLRMTQTDFNELMEFLNFQTIPDIPFFWGCLVIFDNKCYRPLFTREEDE